MEENMGTPPYTEPRRNNRTLIIVIAVLVGLCCCCLVAATALYFGYDSMGDPLGIYGLLPLPGMPG